MKSDSSSEMARPSTVDANRARTVRSFRSNGQPLPTEVRSFFQSRFGSDFSDVRIHTGDGANETARSFGAKAFTTGGNIVFRSGEFRPETAAGRRLLAHELTHVVQQRQDRPTDVVQRQEERSAEDAPTTSNEPPLLRAFIAGPKSTTLPPEWNDPTYLEAHGFTLVEDSGEHQLWEHLSGKASVYRSTVQRQIVAVESEEGVIDELTNPNPLTKETKSNGIMSWRYNITIPGIGTGDGFLLEDFTIVFYPNDAESPLVLRPTGEQSNWYEVFDEEGNPTNPWMRGVSGEVVVETVKVAVDVDDLFLDGTRSE